MAIIIKGKICSIFLVLIAAMLLLPLHSGAVTIYSNDFETSVGSEWTSNVGTPVISNQSQPYPAWWGSNILGRDPYYGTFGRETFTGSGYENNPEIVSLTLTDLPAYSTASLYLDLLVLGSWDGNANYCCGPDYFDLDVNGISLLHTTFSTTEAAGNLQSYPAPANTGSDYPAHTGAIKGQVWVGSVYRMSFILPTTSSSLTFNFYASGPGWQDLPDESWALDNVSVDIAPVPEPSWSALVHVTTKPPPLSTVTDGEVCDPVV